MVRNSFEPQCWYLERVAHQPASGYQPTILNGPQGKYTLCWQDSRCPTFCTISMRYVAPVVEGNGESLNEEKVLMDAKHVRFFSYWARLRPSPQRGLNLLGAAPTVTPARTEPLGAATTVTPAWTKPLGAAMTVTPAWTGPWVRLDLANASRIHGASKNSASRITCGTSSF